MSEQDLTGERPVESEGRAREERRVQAALDVLRTTIRDLYHGHFRVEPPAGSVRLNLSLAVRPGENWATVFDPPLLDQLLPQLADREAQREVLVAGHVFCFRCGSSGCEHGVPPGPRHVFKGFDAAGRPEWQEFAQTLIDEKDQRVDQLFARPPRLVARVQMGRTLKGRQLAAFGKASLSYSLLVQVVVGYCMCRGERLALTLQLVEGRDLGGGATLRLNPVGHGLDGAAWTAWLAEEANGALFRAIQIAGRELEKIEGAVRAARQAGEQDRANQWMGRVPGVARRLAEAVERGGRQGERRTRHVEDRRQDQRPVHKALEDAARARIDSCFYDEKARTFVVVGDRGRAHAFSPAGRHVTSFNVKPSAVAFRVRTERWRPATADEWAEVAGHVSRRGSGPTDDGVHHDHDAQGR